MRRRLQLKKKNDLVGYQAAQEDRQTNLPDWDKPIGEPVALELGDGDSQILNTLVDDGSIGDLTSLTLSDQRIINAIDKAAASYDFNVKNLKLREVRTKKQESYVILHGSELDTLHIAPASIIKNKKIEIALLDLINEFVAEARSALGKYIPKEGDVVLFLHGGEYCRGLIERGMRDGRFEIKNIDNGKVKVAHLSEIKRVNKDIFETLPVCIEVQLHGVKKEKCMIFQDRFDSLVESFKNQKTLFSVEIISNAGKVPMVSMMEDGRGMMDLTERINGLGRLLWEDFYDSGYKDDCSILQKYHTNERAALQNPPLPIFVEFEVRVLGIEVYAHNKLPAAIFEPLTPYVKNLKEVMRNQVEKYMEKVRSSPCYPGFEEMAFVRTPRGSIWERCIRSSLSSDKKKCLSCIDTNENFPDEDGIQYRHMIPDFMELPRLAIPCILSDSEIGSFTMRCFEKTFVVGKKVDIKLMGTSNGDYLVFESQNFCSTMLEVRKTWNVEIDGPLPS